MILIEEFVSGVVTDLWKITINCILFFLFNFATRAGSRAGPVLPNPPSQLSLWEETGVPGENPRLSAER